MHVGGCWVDGRGECIWGGVWLAHRQVDSSGSMGPVPRYRVKQLQAQAGVLSFGTESGREVGARLGGRGMWDQLMWDRLMWDVAEMRAWATGKGEGRGAWRRSSRRGEGGPRAQVRCTM